MVNFWSAMYCFFGTLLYWVNVRYMIIVYDTANIDALNDLYSVKEILFLKFHFRPPLLHVYHLLAFILHTNVHCTLGEKGSKLAQTYFCWEKWGWSSTLGIVSEKISEFYNLSDTILLSKIWYRKFRDQFRDNSESRWPTS